MRIQVLGPLSAEVNGGSIVPSAGKPRQILSLLALYPGRVMPVPTLMEEIWATQPPQSALTTLQTYILQLRSGWAPRWGPVRRAAPRRCWPPGTAAICCRSRPTASTCTSTTG